MASVTRAILALFAESAFRHLDLSIRCVLLISSLCPSYAVILMLSQRCLNFVSTMSLSQLYRCFNSLLYLRLSAFATFFFDETFFASSFRRLHLSPRFPFETFAESVCCREFVDTLGDKLSGKKCITENTHFEVCLNPDVLETAFIQIRRYNKKSSDIKKMNNT